MRALTVIVSAMLLGSATTANWTLAKPQTWTIGWRLTPLPKMPISHDQIICHQHLAPDRRCFTELAVGFSTVAVAGAPPALLELYRGPCIPHINVAPGRRVR